MHMIEIEKAIATLNSSGSYRVFPCLNLDNEKMATHKIVENTQIALCIDTETTGLNFKEARAIELGMVAFEFDPMSGDIIRVTDRYSGFEDPGAPIPKEITEITGITDEMVYGQHFDEDRIKEMANKAHLVIAHNAAFDRKFVENRFPIFRELPWACTCSQIPWNRERLSSKSLEFLLLKVRQVTINAHRALHDAEAVLGLLLGRLPVSGAPIFKTLLAEAGGTTSRVSAIFAPYEKKDLLKKRGYRWNDGSRGGVKTWWRDVSLSQERDELNYLATEIYHRGNTQSVEVKRVDALDRFSIRE